MACATVFTASSVTSRVRARPRGGGAVGEEADQDPPDHFALPDDRALDLAEERSRGRRSPRAPGGCALRGSARGIRWYRVRLRRGGWRRAGRRRRDPRPARGIFASDALSARFWMASSIHPAMRRNSARPSARGHRPAVPIRMPLRHAGGRGSLGTAFLFTVIPASWAPSRRPHPRIRPASDRPGGGCLSVPPVTSS
jgi:hypothetical protein